MGGFFYLDVITGPRVVFAGRREVAMQGLERAHGYLKLPNDLAFTRCAPDYGRRERRNTASIRQPIEVGSSGPYEHDDQRLSSSLDEVLLLTGGVIRAK